MLIGLTVLAICLLAIWYGRDSRDRAIRSQEEVLAAHGMTWQKPDDPLAHELAAELIAARQTRQARLRATMVVERDDTALSMPTQPQQA